MLLWLVDLDHHVVAAWKEAFAPHPEVRIANGDILSLAENTVVSPANSYGFMDGGIDLAYTQIFGLRPQTELQDAIARRAEGYLPVGTSVLVRTGNERIPFMICAPTMMTPGPVPAAHCFYAMAAVLNAATRHAAIVQRVYCPGLGTGTGRVAPPMAAAEMERAYRKWKKTPHDGETARTPDPDATKG